MNATENQPEGRAAAPPGQETSGYAAPYPPQHQAGTPPKQMRGPVLDSRAKSPFLAALLSCLPGLGQVYVGYYQRGFIHILVFAGVISSLSSGLPGALQPLFGIFLAFFLLSNIIDAARRASHYNQILAGGEAMDLPEDFKGPSMGGSIAGGVVLIAAWFILLLHTRFGVSLDWLEYWWPVAPMLFGAYLVFKAIQEKKSA